MTQTTSIADLSAGKKPASPLVQLNGLLEKMKGQLALALPKHMTADRMARLALTAFSTTPKLQQCTPQSIAGALMTASQLGLEPGVNGQGFLVPYGKTCAFIPGWKGLVDLVSRAGRATVWTGAVFEGDDFDYQLGDAPYVRHRPGDETNPDRMTHAYAIGRVNGSNYPVIEVWSVAKIRKHRDHYNKVGNQHYSFRDWEMYARKVPLLQTLKYMPQSVELVQAIAVADAAEIGASAVIDVQGMVVTSQSDIDKDTGEVKDPDAPTLTYAEVISAMQKAKTIEALDDAALGIEAVPDEGQRQELKARYATLGAELIAAST